MIFKINKTYFTGIRNIVQLCFLILTLAIGLYFFIFVFQASSEGDITISRPPGVEAFLPIGGLMGWKLFINALPFYPYEYNHTNSHYDFNG